ncbi:MAG: hypothetical protein GWN18_15565, partial [Thermoplasmata archaeon]|nr:hypothetical protein [Thermoplasmata archaeon]NIS21359.1 hypothetical protein [Thermoplasmata archaeon]NIV80123.1 hypothetical protein [Thermoplasmata archaeon]NIW83938.1 hypothetical protein [Thermoplasmata archaeon]NIW90203.1 hypothetical protein [Thermoplasmata archaeon]
MDGGKDDRRREERRPGPGTPTPEPPSGVGPEAMTVLEATKIIKDRLATEPRLQDLRVA